MSVDNVAFINVLSKDSVRKVFIGIVMAGNTKGGRINVLLTSCLTGLY
jgi:hypothetical protein